MRNSMQNQFIAPALISYAEQAIFIDEHEHSMLRRSGLWEHIVTMGKLPGNCREHGKAMPQTTLIEAI